MVPVGGAGVRPPRGPSALGRRAECSQQLFPPWLNFSAVLGPERPPSICPKASLSSTAAGSLFPSPGVQARPGLPPPGEPALSKGKIGLSERSFPNPNPRTKGRKLPLSPRFLSPGNPSTGFWASALCPEQAMQAVKLVPSLPRAAAVPVWRALPTMPTDREKASDQSSYLFSGRCPPPPFSPPSFSPSHSSSSAPLPPLLSSQHCANRSVATGG